MNNWICYGSFVLSTLRKKRHISWALLNVLTLYINKSTDERPFSNSVGLFWSYFKCSSNDHTQIFKHFCLVPCEGPNDPQHIIGMHHWLLINFYLCTFCIFLVFFAMGLFCILILKAKCSWTKTWRWCCPRVVCGIGKREIGIGSHTKVIEPISPQIYGSI